MKVVVLCTTFPVSLYVAERVLAHRPATDVLIVAPPRGDPPSLRRAVGRPGPTLQKLVRAARVYRHHRSMAAHLWSSGDCPSFVDVPRLQVASVNSPETVDRLRELHPDVLLVSGAPILKPPILDIPRIAAVNLHYGIAPAYRGNDTVFWPILRRDPDGLGLTMHRIDQGIDTGPVLAKAWPALTPEDDEPALYAKLGRLAVTLFEQWAKHVEQGHDPGGVAQAERGELFNRRDRRVRDDARRLIDRHVRRYRLPPRSERVEVYF